MDGWIGTCCHAFVLGGGLTISIVHYHALRPNEDHTRSCRAHVRLVRKLDNGARCAVLLETLPEVYKESRETREIVLWLS